MIRDDNTRIPSKARLLRWKEKLREACLIRAQQSRSELLWKIRSIGECALAHKGDTDCAFGEIVSDELLKIKQGSKDDFPGAAPYDRQDMLMDYEPCDAISELDQEDYEQIMQEMEKILHEDTVGKNDKDVLFEDFEKTFLFVEDSFVVSLADQLQLQQDQDNLQATGLSAQRSGLHVNLDYIRRRLSEVLKQHHTSGCRTHPVFCIDNRFGISALYVQCSACEVFELVL